MQKYKVEIVQTEKFIVDVIAKDEDTAKKEAGRAWKVIAENGLPHYYQEGDTEIGFGLVFDVTNTDDPFNP